MPNYQCLKKPIISEKSSLLQEASVYTFEVEMNSNKSQIKTNVESAYGVDVISVRTIISKGPKKRNPKTGSWMNGKKNKKALVKIKQGQTINIFEGV
jgi:large subunit ribosomal protein L23